MITPSRPSRDPRALVPEVTSRVPLPLDVWEITALLESLGMTDNMARERYGCADVFALADHVLAATRAQRMSAVALPSEDSESTCQAPPAPQPTE